MHRSIRKHVSLAALALIAVAIVASPAIIWGQTRQGDRLGIRGGIWPQPAVSGSLGQTHVYPANTDTLYTARFVEDGFIAPFVEIYGLFHLRSTLWLDLAAGWSTRRNIEVFGTRQEDTLVLFLGSGRIDYFPMFAGIRTVQNLGHGDKPHNVYARGGLAILFANESPTVVQDSITKYRRYTPGTKAAFGFVIATGTEFYLTPNFGMLADAQYRYAKFRYTQDAKIDLSGFWLSLGITFRNR